MKRSIRDISIAFIISLVVIVSVSMLFFKNLRALKEYSDATEHAHQVLNKIQAVQYLLLEAENSQRGYLLTRDDTFLEIFDRTHKLIYPRVESLRQLIKENKIQEQTAIKLEATIAERYLTLNNRINDAYWEDEKKFLEMYGKGKQIMQDFNRYASQMENEELKELAEKNKQRKKYERAAPTYLIIIFIMSLLFLILSFIQITKEFRERYSYQKQLEQKINELNMSHAELEQIAFIASHDLQEPLRKIRTFGGQMLLQFKDTVDDTGRTLLSKMDASAKRMHGLIQDIVEYTNLIHSSEELQDVDLNNCIDEVQQKLSNTITKYKASVVVDELPTLKGYPFQLQLLFTNLIHNSIKFSREGVAPEIKISAEKILATTHLNPFNHPLENEPYLLVKVQDNGIGFENEFGKKIFVIFQRLHHQNSKYSGKGMGLSISKRVMTNHNGFISAEGEPGKGATFFMYFPL